MAQEALGMIETRGLTAAIEAADAMTKAAEVCHRRAKVRRHLRRRRFACLNRTLLCRGYP